MTTATTPHITTHARERMALRGIDEAAVLALPATVHRREGATYRTDGAGLVAVLNDEGHVVTALRSGSAPAGAWVTVETGNTGETRHHHPREWWPAATGHRLVAEEHQSTSMSSVSWLTYAAPGTADVPAGWRAHLTRVDSEGRRCSPGWTGEPVMTQRRSPGFMRADGSFGSFTR